MKPWQKKTWKDKRHEILEERGECEECGSAGFLAVHHRRRLVPLSIHYRIVRHSILKEKMHSGEFKADTVRKITCPNCHTRTTTHVYERKTKQPRFRCMACGSEFDKPALRDTGRLDKGDWRRFGDQFAEEIKERVKKERDDYFEDYENLDPDDVIVLCRRCHFATGKGMDLCPDCGIHYKKKRFDTCYECAQAQKWRTFFRHMDLG